jgi:hypothetical protein
MRVVHVLKRVGDLNKQNTKSKRNTAIKKKVMEPSPREV